MPGQAVALFGIKALVVKLDRLDRLLWRGSPQPIFGIIGPTKKVLFR